MGCLVVLSFQRVGYTSIYLPFYFEDFIDKTAYKNVYMKFPGPPGYIKDRGVGDLKSVALTDLGALWELRNQ